MKKMLVAAILLMGLTTTGAMAHGGTTSSKGENVFEHLHKGDKKAILVVHFGSTVDETRGKTIDVINREYKHDFEDFEVREAFTSREIINKLSKRGIEKDNPMEAMEKLAAEGYTHVLIQTTNIMNGIETENLKNEVEKYADKFEVVRMGTPLLTDTEDYKEVAKVIKKEIPADKDTAVVVVGHGTHHYAGAAYAKMDYVFKAEGYENYFVGTVEGYPAMSDVVSNLKAEGYKKVVLAPFMFVAGDHAMNDIAGDWKDELEEKGFDVSLAIKGLGEYADIQHIYIHKSFDAMVHEEVDMAAKKAELAKK
ncbi:cobalt chelatase [Propionigenium maris DSM 9537]|uniref:Cobalt chelatase n=1 Tax=Propionigenium maris DSM 9537 TaxID=1123000 RepID=A0A9W6GJ93_9FUSO|nr:sirohydrochlorin cobaltochelatase [Propionigenium maris]GLI54899.1 cobalt chelatase [Propionigenium maris DSM 9537]